MGTTGRDSRQESGGKTKEAKGRREAAPRLGLGSLALTCAVAWTACDTNFRHIDPPPPSNDWTPPNRTPPPPHDPVTAASKLDIVLVVDDSKDPPPQSEWAASMPAFVAALAAGPGGLPDLHIGVISTSVGAGRFADVPGCSVGSPGFLGYQFQHKEACTALDPGATFVATSAFDPGTGQRTANFTGDLADVLACLTVLGDAGCGFEQPFQATRLALERMKDPSQPVNVGFLREDAMLVVIVYSNEDDCSVPFDSGLLDPSVVDLAGTASLGRPPVDVALGGLQSYRCNEFGHLCAGAPPPHLPPSSPLALTDCTSREDPLVDYADGTHLYRVNDFVDFLFGLKPGHPERIFVAAIAGSPAPYVVTGEVKQLPSGAMETQPVVDHVCSAANGAHVFPAVRTHQWTTFFGPNAFFGDICDDDLSGTLTALANKLAGR